MWPYTYMCARNIHCDCVFSTDVADFLTKRYVFSNVNAVIISHREYTLEHILASSALDMIGTFSKPKLMWFGVEGQREILVCSVDIPMTV